MNEREFWEEVRRRRNHVFLWWVGWLPFGLIGMMTSEAIFGRFGAGTAWVLLFVWFVGWRMIEKRLKTLRCPRCGGLAIMHPFFFMKDAKCQECGLAFVHQGFSEHPPSTRNY
jgi:hypothetical protein